jgi:hypothetical protein
VVKQDFCVWVSGAPASVAGSIARAVELALAGGPGKVHLETGRPTSTAREEHGRVVEVFVGDLLSTGEGAAPDVVVSGDGARAGESARVVLRHLAAAGYSDTEDEYSDDDEAAVSGRLQAFGYL